MSEKYSALWPKAWLLAAERHQGQIYPGVGLPYLTHLGMVVLTVTPALTGESLGSGVLCAILHDIIEDTETTAAEIETEFGPLVASGVAALTKKTELRGLEATLDSLLRIKRRPQNIWAVKLADRISNLASVPPHWSKKKCAEYALESELICSELGSASKSLEAILKQKISRWHSRLALL